MPASTKITVPQSVFDSPEALRAAAAGHRQAVADLDRVPRHLLDEDNPNHPRYDLHLFGVPAGRFLAGQYRP